MNVPEVFAVALSCSSPSPVPTEMSAGFAHVIRESAFAGAEVSDSEMKDFCRGRIAHFKVPRHVKFVTEFPMTVTGKVQKFKMREESIVELCLEDADAVENA